MSSVAQFSTCARRFEDAPSGFREVLLQHIDESENVKHLIYSPAFVIGKFRTLASVLCVTDKRWLIALRENDGRIRIDDCSYDRTLLAELTIILLHGQLKIDYTLNGEARSTACQFNTVMERVYFRALQDILKAIDGNEKVPTNQDWRNSPILESWPIKFRNVSIIYAPKNSYLVDGVYLAEVCGMFHRQLAPAAAILLTDRHIIIIAEGKPTGWFQFRHRPTYGEIITYFPLSELAYCHVRLGKRFGILELGVRRGGKLEIMFPRDAEERVHGLAKTRRVTFSQIKKFVRRSGYLSFALAMFDEFHES